MKLNSIAAAAQALQQYSSRAASLKGHYDLGRMKQFLAQIGNPQNKYRVIHIAGTSGKTSTAYFVRAMLQAAAQSVGMTISPHLTSITERVQIGEGPLDDGAFLGYMEVFLERVARSGLPLTYFEILVAFAFWVFADRNVDYAVVETGLGGLLDGTNTVTRTDKVCIITDLGLDHMEVLGSTIEEIAAQKAGIIGSGNHVLLIAQDPAAMQVVVAQAKRQAASIRLVSLDSEDPMMVNLPPFQRRNWALARAASEYLAARDRLPSLSMGSLENTIMLQPPGRFERYEYGGKVLILDGAHNPQKLAALREALQAVNASPAAVLVSFTNSPARKLTSMLAELRPLASHIIVPSFAVVQDLTRRSLPAETLAAQAKAIGFDSIEIRPELGDAFAALLRRPEKVLLATGSLYLVGQVRILAEKHCA